jgi:hypothetical protein
MGFLDKAKKLAEQAQTKLDEVQTQFNSSQSGTSAGGAGPAVEYDKHGRPVAVGPTETTTPPQGDPLAGPPTAPPAPTVPTPDASAPAAPPAAPAPPATPAAAEPPNTPSYEPPKMSSGDPLAG